jgi:hypothetical protein
MKGSEVSRLLFGGEGYESMLIWPPAMEGTPLPGPLPAARGEGIGIAQGGGCIKIRPRSGWGMD